MANPCVRKDCPARSGNNCFGPYLWDGNESKKTIPLMSMSACKWQDKVLKIKDRSRNNAD